MALDPLREQSVAEFHAASADLWAALGQIAALDVEIDAPVLVGLGIDLIRGTPDGRVLTGQPPIGMVILEHATLSQAGRDRAEQFALLVAGSSWNAAVLRANGIAATTTVLRGVDTAIFHPAPNGGRFPGRFVVFSGGKLAYRKGQDLVARAFGCFHQRHPEALLVTAWHTPWQCHDRHLAGITGVDVAAAPDGSVDTAGWAIANGVPADALIALGPTPNIAMPHVLREADVALFPNRCEGGTNLPAMECMACGVPVILSSNTGHLDLLAGDAAFRLSRQAPVPGFAGLDTQGWGESDVEEIVEALETVWRDRDAAGTAGRRGAEFIAPHTCQRQTDRLLQAIDPFLP